MLFIEIMSWCTSKYAAIILLASVIVALPSSDKKQLTLEPIDIDDKDYFKHFPTIGNYPMSTSQLGVSFDHRIISMRPRVCSNHDKTNQAMFHCPTPNAGAYPFNEWPCVRYSDLCNGSPDCPQHEDEHPIFCMFHQLENAQMSTLRKIISDIIMKQEQQRPGK